MILDRKLGMGGSQRGPQKGARAGGVEGRRRSMY